MQPEHVAQASGVRIERVDPTSEAARWCMQQYFAELARSS